MRVFIFYCFLFIIMGCALVNSSRLVKRGKVVVGIANQCKISACIVCNENEFYYLLDHIELPDSLKRKKLTLKGDYYIERQKKEIVNGFTKPYIPKKKVLRNVIILKIEEP